MGRAIVRNPRIFLMVEPLSNLDAKLRTQMRAEILRLYQKLKTTFIYVTHDQTEAMTLGTKIVLRTQMRAEILRLYQKLKTTFIYVTHDQTEAMTLGTKIVVMKDGVIQQVEPGEELYI